MPPIRANQEASHAIWRIRTSVWRTSSPTSLICTAARTSKRTKIGALGICASGGYAPFEAQTDIRIKAVDTSAAVCAGTMTRRGHDKDSTTPDTFKSQLEAAGNDRKSDVTGKKVPTVHLLLERFEDAGTLPESIRGLASYYRTPRGNHPRATNTTIPRSWDIMENFDAYAYNHLISPPKELVVLDGLTHANLYDDVDEAASNCTEFFGKYLIQNSRSFCFELVQYEPFVAF
ncbi:alpha beta superfamily hydrolase [Grosmannia clavigera kw1407]|uniref:Alpha beta superfamily hydrolase n=1 Tax=Grosmannia clavigera (strain kw1407 / UAMH 11150) TaxID=655863 RepID=F0XI96_GROCL|nr:alpha beta superfamily hydrolase [Grosmannia clavigera kw1407]EFX03241.1 alpha beta superfamily hydrolase [Grosmannia clavigera kw1407]